jgi:hypothetical protein
MNMPASMMAEKRRTSGVQSKPKANVNSMTPAAIMKNSLS